MNIDEIPILRKPPQQPCRITVLTGAGISAESGIPTFRGPEGYWTIGAKEYHPQEMATFQMFQQKPFDVWQWYLYRLGVCQKAYPNPGHLALVSLEKHLGNRFTLITQNVDGLHLRAGNTLPRTFQIHGNVSTMRCAHECGAPILPIPAALHHREKTDSLTDSDRELLCCPECGGMTRPHVLWFDETYNEEYFRYTSSLIAAEKTDLLIIVGTSGATNLPNLVARAVFRMGKPIVDINITANPFSGLADQSPGGGFIQKASAAVLPRIVERIRKIVARSD